MAFEAVGETTGHSVGWVAGAWGLVVMVGAVVGHALDVAEPLDADD